VWGSRLLGSRLRQRVTGVDLVPALAERAARLGYTIYLFGGSPGTAELAAARLRERYPGAEIIGDTGPVFARPEDMDPEALERIRSARPDIICVALGNPKQERWIDCYRDALGAPVLIGVGGTLDILVGEKRRAPQWTQRIGMEWVYRAAQEPRRLGPRYLQDIRTFVPGFARQAWSLRPRGAGGWRPADIEVDRVAIVVRPCRRLLMADVSPVMAQLALRRIERIVVDLSGVPFVDNASASALATLARQASRSGAAVVLTGVGALAERCLERHKIAGWLDAEPERQLDAVGTLAG
jgi:N-acetylglucosaminyldiphosphoundecaprenol N-acetyl-beta-D-mannosaminyltransferase